MPVTFRLRRDHLGAPYSSETNFVAISGELEIGGVSREEFTDQSPWFGWSISAVNTRPGNGWAATVDEAKAALEPAWFDWVVRDDPDAPQLWTAIGHLPRGRGACFVVAVSPSLGALRAVRSIPGSSPWRRRARQ